MRKWIVIGIVAALVVAGVVVWQSSKGGDSDSNPVLITATAQPRDLRDEVTVNGTVEREEQLTVNSVSTAPATGASAGASAAGSTVSRVYLDDGASLNTGASILAVDGRDSVTVTGGFPFFRRLDVGAEGEDVLQLKAVLAAAGYSPGVVDRRYTEQTRFALAQWQAAHGYPGAAPSVNQSVNVSLQQGSGYKLGDQTSAGLIITPPAVRAAAARIGGTTSDAGARAVFTAVRRGEVHAACADPSFSIQASSPQVNKGSLAFFLVTASCAPDVATPFTVSVTQGSSAVNPPGTFSMAAGATTAPVIIQTINNNLVQPDQTLTLTLDNGAGYTVGSPSSASTTIVSTTLPQLTVSGSTTVQAGQNAVITVTADQAPAQDTQVNFQVGGSAQAGSDYNAFSPSVILPAGQTSATLTVSTKTSTTVKPARTIVLTMLQSGAYKVGPVSSATVTIAATSGNAAIPVVTIRAANLRVQAGQPAQFTIGLDRALSEQLQVNVSYGGNAEQGHDYNPAAGLLLVQPGQTSLNVSVPTLDNGQVSYDKAVFLTLQPSANYVIGDPSSAGTLIVNSTLPKLSIVGGGGSVASGGGATFTIVADQPPIQDISVQYQVTGTAQQGKDIQPVTGSAILAAGQTSVTVSILTLNTNVFFVPTDMIAITGPTQLGQVFVKEGQVIPTGTPLFSLTETNLAVTIDVSAADRTELEVGQAVTVQVQGGDQTAPGVITQLDDFITTDKTTQKQTYQGKVQVKGDLGAADGTPVTVKVIKQERLGALTVPIAAVKQDGDGNDVVRVINVGTGEIREVKVKTGLTEGSYIEVKSGLRARDVVVVQVDKNS